MSMRHPDYMEGLYLPLFMIGLAVVFYFHYPDTAIIIAILAATVVAGLLWLLSEVPPWLVIILVIGVLAAESAMYFHSLPLETIAFITAPVLIILTSNLALYWYSEVRVLIILIIDIITITAAGMALMYEYGIAVSIGALLLMQWVCWSITDH